MNDNDKCNFYWGSHGCGLQHGNHRLHQCRYREIDEDGIVGLVQICCEYDEDAPEELRVRYWQNGEPMEWSAYGEGWRMYYPRDPQYVDEVDPVRGLVDGL